MLILKLHNVSLWIYFFLTHSIFQLLVDSCRRLLLRHYICPATLYVTCFCHSAFCSLLFFFVCFFICFHLRSYFYQICMIVLFTSLYFPLMNSQYLSLMMIHSFLPLSVKQFAFVFTINFLLLVLLQFISRYCFPLISHTVVAIITLSTTAHCCLLLRTPLCYIYFIGW